MSQLEFAHPRLLILLPLACLSLLLLTRWRAQRAALRASSLSLFAGAPRSPRQRSAWLPLALRLFVVALAVLALARPRIANHREVVRGEGIDIALALDISGSMRALDFEPEDRLAVAKRTIREFVQGRTQDRIGLVVFAAKAFTQCPLTLDYGVLQRFLDEVEVGLIDDGTAIGLGIATGVKRLARSTASSKVLVLLTDGVNNVHTVDPETAAETARALGVKIYSIGIGREGMAPYPVDHPVLGRRYTQVETHIDEELLTRVSQQSGGQYFRAQSGESLERIFEIIDALEKTELETTIFTSYRELAAWLLLPALLLLWLETMLAATWYRVLP